MMSRPALKTLTLRSRRFVLTAAILVIGLAAWWSFAHQRPPTKAITSHSAKSVPPPPASTPLDSTPPQLASSVDPTPSSVNPLERALSTPNFQRRARRFKRLGASLAAADLERAFQTLAGLDNPLDREAFIQGMFGGLSSGDPLLALAASKRLTNPADKKAALTVLADTWAGPTEDDGSMLSVVRSFGANADPESSLCLELLNHQPPRSDLAVLWAKTLVTGDNRLHLLSVAAATQYANNPALAESYGAEFTGEDHAKFEQQILADLTSWHSHEPAQHRAATPAGVFPERAVSLVAQMYATDHPNDAVAWARSLPGEEAALALSKVAPLATLGMGMVLGTDKDGYTVISSIALDPASTEAKLLHPFDRILSVSQGDGSFVDVQQMDLLQVAGLITGAPGSAVQLQTSPMQPDGAHGTPTVVPLVRPSPKH